MSRILFVSLCLVGMTLALFAEQTNIKSKKEKKIVKSEVQHIFR